MISIRCERPEDIAVIRTVNETGFDQSTEADIIDALRDVCPDVLSLVAESDGEIVGHILFSPVTIEGGSQSRQGIGSELVQAGLEILRKQGCPFVIVLGHSAFYPRFGFVPASRYGLTSQREGVPDAAFMVLVLDASSMAGVSGVVRYREEFDAAM